jgi:hypothetical protein
MRKDELAKRTSVSLVTSSGLSVEFRLALLQGDESGSQKKVEI